MLHPLLGLGIGLWALLFVFRGVFWLLVVGFVVWLFVRAAGASAASPTARRSTGLDILEQRYARGEIQREEYLEKKRDILAGGAP